MNLNWCPGMTIESMEKEAIRQAMGFYQNDKNSVAQALGISIRTLHNKFATYKAQEEKQKELAPMEAIAL